MTTFLIRLLTRVLTRLFLGLLWLLHWLPLPLLRLLGLGLGVLLYGLGYSRRHIVLTNLRLCFPELDDARRIALARHHVIYFARAFLDRPLLWWASRRRLERLIRVTGAEHLINAEQVPTILLVPHFVGLDAAGVVTTLLSQAEIVSVYSRQKNPLIDARVKAGRERFAKGGFIVDRQAGMRRVLKALKAGFSFFYLPDMDYGAEDAVFVPFFGVPAATITAFSRLARITGARIVPVIARMTPGGYEITVHAPWADFPGDSVEADTRRMNAFIEDEVRRMPEQYYWVHRRFKTRPPGQAKVY